MASTPLTMVAVSKPSSSDSVPVNAALTLVAAPLLSRGIVTTNAEAVLS